MTHLVSQDSKGSTENCVVDAPKSYVSALPVFAAESVSEQVSVPNPGRAQKGLSVLFLQSACLNVTSRALESLLARISTKFLRFFRHLGFSFRAMQASARSECAQMRTMRR